LRDGKLIDSKPIAEVTPRSLVQMMVGQPIDQFYHKRSGTPGGVALRVDKVTRSGFFHDVSFTAGRGEILGIVGLNGAGRSELARSMVGLDPLHAGRIELNGELMPVADYPAAVQAGFVYLTEDRKNDGLFLRLSIIQNSVVGLIPKRSKCGVYDSSQDRSTTLEYMELLQTAASSEEDDVGNLSGGNQQKVLLAKCLAVKPRVLILDEPSRGVDVKAQMMIHEAVMALADRGATVLLISSDLPELVGLADRAVVLRNGRLIAEMSKEQMSEESVLLAANGEAFDGVDGEIGGD
jgi:ABC-type sugar transport system ATPase subunit